MGCAPSSPGDRVIAEGIIHSVSYARPDGTTAGLTRMKYAQAVPGGNGSFDVRAFGRLTKEFLILEYPENPELKCHVIPVHCLTHVQFVEDRAAP